MKFAYQRTGGPLLDWSGSTSPSQSRAGTTRSLGAFYPTARTSNALRRYGGRSVGHSGAAIGYEHNRSLGAFYPTVRTSNAIRQYGGAAPSHNGAAIGYEHNRSLGSLDSRDVPNPGAPEIVSGYESPQPGAATVHLGAYMPEGAAVRYGQQFLGDAASDAATAQVPLSQKVQDWVGDPVVKKAAVIASAYHGVRRHNGSVLWGLLWAVGAYAAPVNGLSAVALAIAQGFGKVKPGCP